MNIIFTERWIKQNSQHAQWPSSGCIPTKVYLKLDTWLYKRVYGAPQPCSVNTFRSCTAIISPAKNSTTFHCVPISKVLQLQFSIQSSVPSAVEIHCRPIHCYEKRISLCPHSHNFFVFIARISLHITCSTMYGIAVYSLLHCHYKNWNFGCRKNCTLDKYFSYTVQCRSVDHCI